MTEKFPRVGIGIICVKENGHFLFGKRKSAHGDGTWAPPGGHLEFGESFEEAAIREVKEETGLTLRNCQVMTVRNHIFSSGKHYVSIYMIGYVDNDPPQIKEPDKVEVWQYFDKLADIPHPHFVPYAEDINQEMIASYIRATKSI